MMKMSREIRQYEVDDIYVGKRRRALREEAVKDLAASMRKDGLLYPISIRVVDGPVLIDGEELMKVPCLIAGAHRLAAAKLNGWKQIECQLLTADDIEAERLEIVENYHRADLSLEERARDFARLKELAQLAPVLGGHGIKGGVREVARQLNMERTQAQRLDALGNISEEAWLAAKEEGIENNQSALLSVAGEDAEKQADKIRELAKRKQQRKEIASAQDVINQHDDAAVAADILASYIPEEEHDRLIAALSTVKTKDLIRAYKAAVGDRVAA
jgi:hypothetical protein